MSIPAIVKPLYGWLIHRCRHLNDASADFTRLGEQVRDALAAA